MFTNANCLCFVKLKVVHLKWTANKTASINPIYNFLVYASLPFESNWKKPLKTIVFSLNSTLKLSMDKLTWKHSQSYRSGFPLTLQVILKLLPKFYSFYSNEREAKKNTSGMSTACSLYGYRYSTQSDPNTSHSCAPRCTETIHSPALCPRLGTRFMFQTGSWQTFQHT